MVNYVLTVQSIQISRFTILATRIRFELKHDKCKVVTQLSNGYSHFLVR
jgi:hypothetical protein